jgi:general secretion pathway protein M
MGAEWLTGRRGQVLAVGVTLLLLLMVWIGAVQPLLAWHADRAETLLQQRVLADRMANAAATLPALRRQAEAGTGGHVASAATLAGASDAIAGATLQEQVQAMATAAGATLTSAETLPAEQTGAWRRIGLRLTLTAAWPVLVKLLEAIDRATPQMLVDDLHVHSVLLVARPVALPLQTSFTVYAFRAAPATTAAASGTTRP